jgi:uncharacterized membrane protein
MATQQTWHQKHRDSLSFGQRLADTVAKGMGSWRFIVVQTAIVLIWMIINIIGYFRHWDPYPYILLTLLFSTQAALAAPMIMMAQNYQGERDRMQADQDFKTNVESKMEIEELQMRLNAIEIEKFDKLISMVEELKAEIRKA